MASLPCWRYTPSCTLHWPPRPERHSVTPLAKSDAYSTFSPCVTFTSLNSAWLFMVPRPMLPRSITRGVLTFSASILADRTTSPRFSANIRCTHNERGHRGFRGEGRSPASQVEIQPVRPLSLIHISEPTRLGMISYAVFCLKK